MQLSQFTSIFWVFFPETVTIKLAQVKNLADLGESFHGNKGF